MLVRWAAIMLTPRSGILLAFLLTHCVLAPPALAAAGPWLGALVVRRAVPPGPGAHASGGEGPVVPGWAAEAGGGGQRRAGGAPGTGGGRESLVIGNGAVVAGKDWTSIS